MSRHPSPTPQPHSHHFQHTPVATSRTKSKAYTTGIAAGAEDVKYQAKYKDLKRKVKEIESDNDKLHFKVLQSKRSIQRMKLERAVLYERLSVVPPSPDIHDRAALPPIQGGPGLPPIQHGPPGTHQMRDIRNHPPASDSNDSVSDYYRAHPNVRLVQGPDGRPIQVAETPMGPGVAPSSHGLPLIHPGTHGSGQGHDSSRQLPPLPHLPPVQLYEGPRVHHIQNSSPHAHPHMHEHAHSQTSRSRASQGPPPHVYHSGPPHPQQYDGLPPMQHVLQGSPLGGERERHRRQDHPELISLHHDSHSRSHTEDVRRIHNHQRTGPGTYVNRAGEHHERDYEGEREREWEHGRDYRRDVQMSTARLHSPPPHRPRQQEYQEHPMSRRDDQGYYHGAPGHTYPMPSRSGSPGSGSSGQGEGPSRPDSRSQFYDRTRYALRPVSQPNEDHGFVHEDGRSQSRDRVRGGGFSSEQNRDTRKRSRNDMDADSENDVGDAAVAVGGRLGGEDMTLMANHHQDRGTKRFHPDSSSVRDEDPE